MTRQSLLGPLRLFRRHAATASSSDVQRSRLLDILFLGSDHFSIGTLDAVLNATGLWRDLQVMTMPEKVMGRGGGKRVRPPLHDFAEERGLKVHEVPESGMTGWEPPSSFPTPSATSILIISSFGHILPSSLLQKHFPLPETRLNIHPSLLPRYRGAAPIQRAIMAGEDTTGVVVQSLSWEGVDKGEIWGMRDGVPINPTDTYTTLLPRLASVGGDLLVQVLREIQSGNAAATPQDPTVQATRAPKITRKTARVDFKAMDARRIERVYRGIGHHQTLWTDIRGKETQLLEISTVPLSTTAWISSLSPGQATIAKIPSSTTPGLPYALVVRCATPEKDDEEHVVVVRKVKPVNGKEMAVGDWWNGLRVSKVKVIEME